MEAYKGETMRVIYGNHDNGACDGEMVRDSVEDAKRAAELMRECGYQTVRVVEA